MDPSSNHEPVDSAQSEPIEEVVNVETGDEMEVEVVETLEDAKDVYSDGEAQPVRDQVYRDQEEKGDAEGHNEKGERQPTEDKRAEQTETAPDQPPSTPISWKEATKTSAPTSEDPEMPSFVDSSMLDQIEVNAKQSASNLVVLVHHLRTQLAAISSLSVQYMILHKTTIEGVSEQLHEGIAATQKLILKAQSLNSELKKISIVQGDIKETKKLLSQLEKIVEKMTKS